MSIKMINIALAKDKLEKLVGHLLGESSNDIGGLLFPWHHPELIVSQRSSLIISRVRFIATLFALLTPLWSILDIIIFDARIWIPLVAGRGVASVAFIFLATLYQRSDRLIDAYLAIILLFSIPTTFFLFSHYLFVDYQVSSMGIEASVVAAYAFLPFILITGLSIFPLTALEGIAFVIPALLVEWVTGAIGGGMVVAEAQMGLIWLMALIGGVAVLSGVSQLHYFSEIIFKLAHDPLTKAFTRSTGGELLEKYFHLSNRNNSPLTLLFFDLDHFKSINDNYGHEAGDDALILFADNLKAISRKVDLVIRWGGEEFLLILPHMDRQETAQALDRLIEQGLGSRPDGELLTASIGFAEVQSDNPQSLSALIELADQRMYLAKQGGRNRVCFSDSPSDFRSLF
jgi:diguanylate cyclase (GGDEF)-like protein